MCRLACILFVLFVLGRTQSHFIPIPPPTCPYFDAISKPTARTGGTCSFTEVCCPASHETKIASHTDPISNALFDFFDGTVTGSCSEMIHSLACTACAPDQATYLFPASSAFQLKLCPSFCDELYTQCGTKTVKSSSKSVKNTYPSGRVFCSKLFDGVDSIIPSIPKVDDHACFNPSKPPCTAEDVEFSYTECILGKTDLHFFWDSDTCTAGVSLPPSKEDLRCPISCLAGSYLPLGETGCKDCPAGTFSLGGGHKVLSFDPLPTRFLDFSTWCENYSSRQKLESTECTGWKGYATYMDANIQKKANTVSVLEVTGSLYNDGEITFVAQIDAEKGWDTLTFRIDGNIQPLLPYANIPTKYTFKVPAGYHRFAWEYAKDISLNVGRDTVLLFEVEVTNMLVHNNYCTDCPAGYFSNPGSVECTICPENTYAESVGSASCLPCNLVEEYSYPGASECIPREPCVEGDYYSWFTDCRADGKRTKKHSWVEPKVCKGGVSLPSDETVPCAPCNPGHELISGKCVACPEGEAAAIGETCRRCSAGEYAPKELVLEVFHEQLEGFVTGCAWGDCSSGWILEGDYISSGTHHGSTIEVYFTLPVNITAEPHGYLSFDYELQCEELCWVEVYDGDKIIAGSWLDSNSGSGLRTLDLILLETGEHTLTWNFIQIMGSEGDNAKVHKIKFQGVDKGGAESCVHCTAGTFSPGGVSSCGICDAGYFSGDKSSSCTICPANTFSDAPGSGECLPCGSHTTTLPGQPECSVDGCVIKDSTGKMLFDLSDLGMDTLKSVVFGDYEYFVHPCGKISEGPCASLDKPTFACRVNSVTGDVEDFGRVQGYHLLPDNGGVKLEFKQGDQPALCGQGEESHPVPRTLDVNFICDFSAGFGFPELIENADPVSDAEFPKSCHASLNWHSAYVCKSCSPSDYSSFVTACEGEVQQVTYFWKEPKVCVGGVDLPPAKEQACGGSFCNAGQFMKDGDCETCPDNTYSVGNGELYSDFGESMAPFEAFCGEHHVEENCGDWSIVDGKLTSGVGNSSLTLTASFYFGQDSVAFDYSVGGHGLFSFFVDEEPTPRYRVRTSLPETGNFSTVLNPGQHVLKWNYFQDTLPFENARPGFVKLTQVRVTSAANVEACSTCAPGLVPSEGRDACEVCPPNTYPHEGVCAACRASAWRLPGDTQTNCSPRAQCSEDDFLRIYENITESSAGVFCSDNSARNPSIGVAYVPVLPKICKGDTPAVSVVNQCLPCPAGTIFAANGKCEGCSDGQFLAQKPSENSATEPAVHNFSCRDTNEGYVPVYSRHFFDHQVLVNKNELPAGWKTSCYGTCGSDGWVLTNSGVSTGHQFGTATLKLEYEVDLWQGRELENSVNFMVTAREAPRGGSKRAASTAISGLEFFVDDRIQELPFQLSYSTQAHQFNLVPHGSLKDFGEKKVKLTWVFSHSGGVAPLVTISEVKVVGTLGGVALSQVACPNGFVVNVTSGLKLCAPCPAGSYESSLRCLPCPATQTSDPGSTHCNSCAAGTYPSDQGTCDTTCVFNITSEMVIVTPTDKDREVFMTYDVNGLSADLEWKDHTSNSYYFHVNPCTRLTAQSLCPSCGETGEAYAYMQRGNTTSTPFQLGSSLEFMPLYSIREGQEDQNTFMLSFTGGSHFPDYCKSVTTNLKFTCRQETSSLQVESLPEEDDSILGGEPRDCVYHFKWATVKACRRCTEEDWTWISGECVNGFKSGSWVQANSFSFCLGEAPAVPEPVDCSDEHTVDVPLMWGYIVGIAALVILLLSALIPCVLHYNKRRVQERYSALKERLDGGEAFDRL